MGSGVVISQVRDALNDIYDKKRFSDDFIKLALSRALKTISLIRPDLFITTGEVTIPQGAYRYRLTGNATRFVEALRVKNGPALYEVEKGELDRAFPSWTITQGAIQSFARDMKDPLAFYVCYPPSSPTVVEILYSASPESHEAVNSIPEAYIPAVIAGTVWQIELVDTEYASSPRAETAYTTMKDMLALNLASRALTSTEFGGLDKREVG